MPRHCSTVRVYVDGAHLRHLISQLKREDEFHSFLDRYDILHSSFELTRAPEAAALHVEICRRLVDRVRSAAGEPEAQCAIYYFDCEPPRGRRGSEKFRDLQSAIRGFDVQIPKGKLVPRRSCWHSDVDFVAKELRRACDRSREAIPEGGAAGRLKQEDLASDIRRSLRDWARQIRSVCVEHCRQSYQKRADRDETHGDQAPGAPPCPALLDELTFIEKLIAVRIENDRSPSKREFFHYVQKGVDVSLAVSLAVDLISNNTADGRRRMYGVLLANDDDFTPAVRRVNQYFSGRSQFPKIPRLFLATTDDVEGRRFERVASLFDAFEEDEIILMDEILRELVEEQWRA